MTAWQQTHAWHESHENLVILCRYLVEEHVPHIRDARTLLWVIEEPWKWSEEFEQAQQHFATGGN